MLKSLYIQNYRCLDSLRIHQLKRVNLITGKNNTGKSSILEAMAIYASRGDRSVLFQILEDHGEYLPKNVDEYDKVDPFELISTLFTNRKIKFDENDTIYIGENNMEAKDALKYYKEAILVDNAVILNIIIPQDSIDNPITLNNDKAQVKTNKFSELQLFIAWDRGASITPLDSNIFKPIYINDPYKKLKHQLVNTTHIARDENGVLFDKIALTDNEKYVIEALQIIEPKIERIAFIQDNPLAKLRVSKVKLKDSIGTVPLRSMGDGINRILTIILALINSKDGYLMIDEFENGLHHSVQAKLWEIIIKLSKELNVQVFVTTHSNDTIRSVRNALSEMSEEDRNDVSTIKLMRTHEDKLEALLYDYEQLDYVIEQDIEIR